MSLTPVGWRQGEGGPRGRARDSYRRRFGVAAGVKTSDTGRTAFEEELFARIGRLDMKLEWLKKTCPAPAEVRRSLLEPLAGLEWNEFFTRRPLERPPKPLDLLVNGLPAPAFVYESLPERLRGEGAELTCSKLAIKRPRVPDHDLDALELARRASVRSPVVSQCEIAVCVKHFTQSHSLTLGQRMRAGFDFELGEGRPALRRVERTRKETFASAGCVRPHGTTMATLAMVKIAGNEAA